MNSMFKLCLISSSGFRGDQMLKSNNRQSAGKSSIEPLTPPSKNLLVVQYCLQSTYSHQQWSKISAYLMMHFTPSILNNKYHIFRIHVVLKSISST